MDEMKPKRNSHVVLQYQCVCGYHGGEFQSSMQVVFCIRLARSRRRPLRLFCLSACIQRVDVSPPPQGSAMTESEAYDVALKYIQRKKITHFGCKYKGFWPTFDGDKFALMFRGFP